MNKNWYQLNISIDHAVKSNFDYYSLIKDSDFLAAYDWIQYHIGEDQLTNVFNVDWLSYMKDLDLEVKYAYMFYRRPLRPGLDPNVHVDGYQDNPLSIPINWVITPDNNDMVWYELKPDARGVSLLGSIGREHTVWSLEEVIEIDRHCLGNVPTLVRIDMPHSIDIRSPRCSLSVRTVKKTLGWDQTVDLMKDFIK